MDHRHADGDNAGETTDVTVTCRHCKVTVTRTASAGEIMEFCGPRCARRDRTARWRYRRRQALAQLPTPVCDGCQAKKRTVHDRGGGLEMCNSCFELLDRSCFRKQAQSRAAADLSKIRGTAYRCRVCGYWHRTSAAEDIPWVGERVAEIVAGLTGPGTRFEGRQPIALRAAVRSAADDDARS